MRAKAPGKSYRKGLSLVQLTAMFHDDATARAWFEKQFWPNGPVCPYCHSSNVQSNIKHKTMTHRCRECPKRRMFSLKTGTVMASTNLPYKVWAIAVYLLTTNLKGVSSLKLHRDLEISQKSAWHLAHRIRKSHYCPVKSRIESVGWGHRVSFRGSRTAARPVKWAFSRKG